MDEDTLSFVSKLESFTTILFAPVSMTYEVLSVSVTKKIEVFLKVGLTVDIESDLEDVGQGMILVKLAKTVLTYFFCQEESKDFSHLIKAKFVP